MKTLKLPEIIFKIAVITGLATVIFLQYSSMNSIVYVDAVRLMNNYRGMISARAEYELKINPLRANLDTLKKEFETKLQEYHEKEDKLSVSERKLYEELLGTKEQQYLSYQKAITEKMQREDQELTQKVLSKVNDYIKKYGEENGYDIIMAATQQGNIVYADKGKDMTDEILEGLNKEFTK
jgi:outer membrane protein